MKCIAISLAATTFSVVALGCPFPEQCIGDCEPDPDGTSTTGTAETASTSRTSSTAPVTPTGSDDSPGTSSGSTAMADDESGTTGSIVYCDGSPLALCLPATEDEDAWCLCPDQQLDSHDLTTVVDLDGDGAADLLAWELAGSAFQPYLTTKDGLVTQDPEPSPEQLRIRSLYQEPDGALRLLLVPSGNDIATEIWRYALAEGFESEPLMGTQIPELAGFFGQTLADYDGDGTLDLAEIWGEFRSDKTVGVLFDVLGTPVPAAWSADVGLPGFYTSVIPCQLDDDGADDAIVKDAIGNAFAMWGLPMLPSMALEELSLPEGGVTCRDLDGDGDGDLLSNYGCYDCSSRFGGYAVYEQIAPGEFELASSGDYFGDDRLGNRTVLAHLTDPTTPDLLSLDQQGLTIPPESTLGLRRPTGPLQWEDGRYAAIEAIDVHLLDVIDTDLDGIDELIVSIVEGPDDLLGTYVYRVDSSPG